MAERHCQRRMHEHTDPRKCEGGVRENGRNELWAAGTRLGVPRAAPAGALAGGISTTRLLGGATATAPRMALGLVLAARTPMSARAHARARRRCRDGRRHQGQRHRARENDVQICSQRFHVRRQDSGYPGTVSMRCVIIPVASVEAGLHELRDARSPADAGKRVSHTDVGVHKAAQPVGEGRILQAPIIVEGVLRLREREHVRVNQHAVPLQRDTQLP